MRRGATGVHRGVGPDGVTPPHERAGDCAHACVYAHAWVCMCMWAGADRTPGHVRICAYAYYVHVYFMRRLRRSSRPSSTSQLKPRHSRGCLACVCKRVHACLVRMSRPDACTRYVRAPFRLYTTKSITFATEHRMRTHAYIRSCAHVHAGDELSAIACACAGAHMLEG